MYRLEKKHALAVRWFHWINFPLLFLMIYSGLIIYWANDVYRVGFGQVTLFHFFPQWIYDRLHLAQRLADGMALHFFFMWLFIGNGVLYVAYLAWSGEWRAVVPDRHSFYKALLVTLHDLRLRKTAPAKGKYNDAQRIAYFGVVVMAAGSLVTGLAIYKPAQLGWLAALLGGYQMARWEHFWLTIGFLLFFVIHVAQVIRAGWGNFQSMVAGYALEPAATPGATHDKP